MPAAWPWAPACQWRTPPAPAGLPGCRAAALPSSSSATGAAVSMPRSRALLQWSCVPERSTATWWSTSSSTRGAPPAELSFACTGRRGAEAAPAAAWRQAGAPPSRCVYKCSLSHTWNIAKSPTSAMSEKAGTLMGWEKWRLHGSAPAPAVAAGNPGERKKGRHLPPAHPISRPRGVFLLRFPISHPARAPSGHKVGARVLAPCPLNAFHWRQWRLNRPSGARLAAGSHTRLQSCLRSSSWRCASMSPAQSVDMQRRRRWPW